MKISMFNIVPYGDSALLINFEQAVSTAINDEVVLLYRQIIQANIEGVISVIPSYCSITIRYISPLTFQGLIDLINTLKHNTQQTDYKTYKDIFIPVCYHHSLALDKEEIEEHTGLKWSEIINLHTANTYRVFMIGFTPGFPYLGGLHDTLITPRLSTPRLTTPKGSVGIANNQTGIYPSESPGGWQIIGQTPKTLFNPEKEFILSIGDSVQFYEISLEEFNNWTDEN